jgi:glycosyltransferase involved in cell wall biosynthesis
MAKASVLVVPSLSEGLGRVIFEAMACRIPVIGSRVGGIPDLITDEVTGFLVSPGDQSALASKISWILNNPVRTHEMGLRARKFAENFFSPEIYVRKYMHLLELAKSKKD